MKKIFSLFLAVVCCSMVFGQIISVTDGSLADWKNVPSEYLFKTECAPNAIWDGLKSVQVYVDMTYINLLVEVNDEVVTDLEWTPFHVFINSDNNSSTGGYGDQWTDADTDLMLEAAIYSNGYVNPYNPGVFKWWGANGENGWWWTDPNGEPTPENGWGALVPEGSMPIGNAQMVDGKIEIQLDYTQIPMPFDETTFTLGFDIQQYWSSVGVLPNANEDENGNNVLAEKLRVNVHQQNKTKTTIGGIQYRLTSDVEPYTAEVFSLKEASVTEIAIPETIAVGGITYTVTSIGEYAFSECSSLTSIVIPNSVTSIGDMAFGACSSLTSITIPKGVTNIGENAFAGCGFTNFINNSSLNAEENMYWGATIYEENGLLIVDSVVVGCHESVTSVVIPDTIIGIKEHAFSDCQSLDAITIPRSVRIIENEAFLECISLSSIVVDSDNTIYDSRENCNAIIETATNTLILGCQNTIIPNTIAHIGHAAFFASINLSSITIPNSVTSIGDYAFGICLSLTDITIPSSVTTIGDGAFEACESLISITLPNTLTYIGNDMFFECYSLSSITIPNSVTTIGDYAFAECSSLVSIIIPNSVTNIGKKAFRECSSLDTIISLSMTPPAVGEDVFLECNNPTLFVPCEALEAYRAHEQWGQFANIQCIASEEVEIDDVIITPSTTSVTITWPTAENAYHYVIEIKKDGEVFCTLTFNADGQLLNIAFAPSREGNNRPVQYAEQTVNGYRFTVTGLTEATEYAYDITTKDAANKTIATYSGEFTTKGGTTTDMENIQSPVTTCQKIMHNGQLIILRDGKTYTTMGAEIQ